MTKDDVVRAVKARARAKLSLNGEAVMKQDRGLYKAAGRAFGKKGWKLALRAAGVEVVNPLAVWPKPKLVIREIRRRWRESLPLSTGFLIANGSSSLVSAGRRFWGTWEGAITAAGLDYGGVRLARKNWWTKRRVLDGIRSLSRDKAPLSLKWVQAHHCDLFGGAIRCFGSWQRAVEAAGFNYREHCQIWSTKAWLRTLTTRQVDALEIQTRRLAQERRRTT